MLPFGYNTFPSFSAEHFPSLAILGFNPYNWLSTQERSPCNLSGVEPLQYLPAKHLALTKEKESNCSNCVKIWSMSTRKLIHAYYVSMFIYIYMLFHLKGDFRDSPGCPMLECLCSQSRGHSSIPGRETRTLHAHLEV